MWVGGWADINGWMDATLVVAVGITAAAATGAVAAVWATVGVGSRGADDEIGTLCIAMIPCWIKANC